MTKKRMVFDRGDFTAGIGQEIWQELLEAMGAPPTADSIEVDISRALIFHEGRWRHVDPPTNVKVK